MSARATARRAVVGVVALLATTVATHHSEHRGEQLDVTVVAVATPADPSATDDALEVARLGGRSSRVQSSSTATSDCEDCSAVGSAVTVAYVSGARTTRADNVAHAWSSCVGCTSTTVSVQVVVMRHAGTLRADNRAFAANVACETCTTSAVAYQLVVVAPGGKAFDRRALAELTRWARAQAAEATDGPALRRAAPPPSEDERLRELEEQAAKALGRFRTIHVDVDTSAAPAGTTR